MPSWQALKNTWDWLDSLTTDRGVPSFDFRDGPVATAAKLGGVLLLESFDLPSAAVSERLNRCGERGTG